MKKKRSKKRKFYDKMLVFKHKIEKKFSQDTGDAKSLFGVFEVTVIVIISIFFGVFVGGIIAYNKGGFFVSRKNEVFNEIASTYDNILDEFYGEVSEDKLADAAIKGMIDSLKDPYSNYMDSKDTEIFNETVDGSFVGIGVTVIYEEEFNTIVDVVKKGPADKAGIKVGDIIVKVDNVSCQGVYGGELAKLVRGKKNSKTLVVVKRGDEEKSFVVKRDTVEIASVVQDVIDYKEHDVGYISISTFSANTFKQFKEAILLLKKKKIDSLIIDVRNNPGGHLSQVQEILSMFFDKKTVLYQIEAKNSKKKVYSLNNDKLDLPVVILTNGVSASASEILAAAFKEQYKRGLIVGETTYGKGSVQKSKILKDGTSIKYTTQKWLTSKGEWINGSGVSPDYEVSMKEEYYANPTQENDTQLQEALRRIVEIK